MIRIFKKFFAFCGKENRKKFHISIIYGALMGFLQALRVPAAFVMVDALLKDSVTPSTCLISFGIILGSVVAGIIVRSKSIMLQCEAGYGTCADKRIEIARHMRYLPMGYFNKNSLGYITSVTTNTMEMLADIAAKVVMLTTEGLLEMLLIIVMLFTFNIKIALVVLAGTLVFLAVNMILQKEAEGIAEEKDSADRNMVSMVLEYIQGMQEVKSYALYSDENKRLSDSFTRAENANFSMEKKFLPYFALQSLVTKAIGIVMSLMSLRFYMNGSMELSVCIVMLVCSFMIFNSLDMAGRMSSLLRTVSISVDKANEILNLEPMDIEGKDIVPKNHDIDLENITFSYEKRKIIDGLSLHIKEGTTTAIVGPSGGGKTTICRLMARFWDVDSGTVKLGGVNVKDYSVDSLMKNFSFVFQNVYLFDDTIANNIRFGRPEASMDEVTAAAKKACCHEFISALPNGYETDIGEAGAMLSGGEKQRISIARAIMKDAPVIVLDEATANVDPENEKELVKAIEELTRKKTIIMIAHRLKTVRNADEIIVVKEGKIVQRGRHDELMREDNIYRRFVNSRETAVSWKL
ncbi:multidrug ABC transporter ATP-binding protein [Eubacterium minutum ATCC 700079]|nr:multidrug ABC transporter ATP-binding protein [Eubacterium minutum ATCC 700079]